MVQTTYTKSLTTDFGGNINESQLHREIASAIPGTTLVGVNRTGDVIDLIFADALSGGNQTILNTTISNHVPMTGTRKSRFFTYTPKTTKTNNTIYQRLGGPFKYNGSIEMGPINQVEVISKMDTGATSYSVRLYDATNETIIAETTGKTNLTESIVDLGTISNVPEDEAILEIHIKLVGGTTSTYAYIEDVVIYYNNSSY
jgi:hypothetical protein